MNLANKDEIVISGISGRLPECENVDEFMDNLYANKDMVVEDDRRWPIGFLNLPRASGKLKDLSKFDAQFFGVNDDHADLMDPQMRIMLELTYEAICDAGVDPNQLSGTKTGTFIGKYYDDVPTALEEDISKFENSEQNFGGIISKIFNFTGPSIVVDTACSSALFAFNEAVASIRHNLCDQAIVVGINISLRPSQHFKFALLNMLSPDGHSKCLDSSVDGYAKGEACVAFLLQKSSKAKRIYATIVNSKTNCDGYKEEGITFPSSAVQSKLMTETYSEMNINPNDIDYIEAHCTGTPAGDRVEMEAIVDAMCSERTEPLLVGAVKSSIGHTEVTSGLCSLIKVIFSMENQCIPANIHFVTPNPNIPGLMNGKLKPITVNTPFTSKLVAVNSFGFGGANAHVIVRGHQMEPTPQSSDCFDGTLRLVLMCGRTEQSLKSSFDKIVERREKWTNDYLSLITNMSRISPFGFENTGYGGMPFRGYMIKDQNDTDFADVTITEVPEKKREVWYIIAGMGAQWPAMARDMMKLKPFAKSIELSAEYLKDYKIDLINILMDDNIQLIDNPFNSMLSLIIVGIALIDVLRGLEITPDGIIGYSVGELVAGYADECLTHEEMVRLAYEVASYSQYMSDHSAGKMAAVGLELEELQQRLPEDVYIACYNANDSFTISGTEDSIDKFMAKLNEENIFVRPVQSSGCAFHCPLIGANLSMFLSQFRRILPDYRRRSDKWYSTVYPKSDDRGHYISADYYADNITSPVLFSNALDQVPKNAILIEVSPHNIMQSMVKRNLGSDHRYVPLMKKNVNNSELFLQSVGTIYCSGINPNIEVLYPQVKYPVVRGTPALSPIVNWDHNKSYKVYKYPEYFNPTGNSEESVKFDLREPEHSYLSGHCIDGRVLFPATGYLLLVWKQFAEKRGVSHSELPVQFENVRFRRATLMPKEGVVTFTVKIDNSNGKFVISESGSVTTTGRIMSIQRNDIILESILNEKMRETSSFYGQQNGLVLQNVDIYKELRIRGYDYGPSFQSISRAFIEPTHILGEFKWMEWVSFADAMLQMAIIGKKYRALYLPVAIECVKCDPRQMVNFSDKEDIRLPVLFDNYTDICVSKFIEMRGIKASLAPKKVARSPLVEKYIFVPYDHTIQSGDENESIKRYRHKCYEFASNLIAKHSSNLTDDEINDQEQYFHTIKNSNHINYDLKDPSNCLLNILDRLNSSDEIDSSLEQKILDTLESDLDKDMMNKSFLREEFLRPQIDITIENIEYNLKRINVLEVNQSEALMAESVIQLIRLSTLETKVNYSLFHPKANDLNPELLTGVDCYQWTVEKDGLPSVMSAYDLVFYNNSMPLINSKSKINLKTLFDSLWDLVKSNGFLIVVNKTRVDFCEEILTKIMKNSEQTFLTNEELNQRNYSIISEAQRVGFSLIATKTDDISNKNSLIFRKLNAIPRVEDQTFIRITTDSCEQWIQKLQNELKSIADRPETQNIWLIADDCPTNGVIGFVNCLKREPNGHRIRCILNYNFNDCKQLNITENNELLKKIIANNLVINVINTEQQLGSFRHFSIEKTVDNVMSDHCYLNVQTRGDLSSFKWFEAQHKYWPLGKDPNEQIIDVYYAPLNFRDIMLATGKLAADALPDGMGLQDCILGLEFAGKDQNSNRVMGMTASKGLATSVVLQDMQFVWPIPENWSMEEASTVPVVYATAYYSLIIRGKLKPKESVLIHSGSGGVGQAAIAICLSMDCQLFISCGSEAKREFLKKEFSPKLCDKNFCSSRDLSFETFIKKETNGRGVDLVLNSLAEDKLQASVRCLATSGRFLEIGKYDLSQNNELELSNLWRNKTFHGILLDSLFIDDSKCSPVLRAHKQRVGELIENGIRDGTVRPLKRTVFDRTQVEQAFRFMASGQHMGKVVLKIKDEKLGTSRVKYAALPRTVFKPNKCYLIIGGLGGFGLELVDWMIERGAKNFVLTSRSGVKTSYQKYRLKCFEEMGINIKLSTKNVCDFAQAEDLIRSADKVGSAQGVGGIFNLAMVLSDAIFENQTSEKFKEVLLPKAMAVQHLDSISRSLCPDLQYFVCFSSVSCGRGNSGQTNYGFANSVMERVCEYRRSSSLPALAIQWGAIGDVGVVAESMGGNDRVIGGTLPQRISSCLSTLDTVLQMDVSIVSSVVKPDIIIDDKSKKSGLMDTIATILGLKDYKKLDEKTSLGELGIDSLMSVEIKQTLDREYELTLSTEDIRRLNIKQIIDIRRQK